MQVVREWFTSRKERLAAHIKAAWPVVAKAAGKLSISAAFAFCVFLVARGFWLAWEPLGYIIPGSFGIVLLVWGHLRAEANSPPEEHTDV